MELPFLLVEETLKTWADLVRVLSTSGYHFCYPLPGLRVLLYRPEPFRKLEKNYVSKTGHLFQNDPVEV